MMGLACVMKGDSVVSLLNSQSNMDASGSPVINIFIDN
jgi:hypothetical protein